MRVLLPVLALIAVLGPGSPARGEEAPKAASRTPQLREVAQLEGHAALVRTLAFTPSGDVLASGSSDRSLRLWDVKTREAADTVVLPRGG